MNRPKWFFGGELYYAAGLDERNPEHLTRDRLEVVLDYGRVRGLHKDVLEGDMEDLKRKYGTRGNVPLADVELEDRKILAAFVGNAPVMDIETLAQGLSEKLKQRPHDDMVEAIHIANYDTSHINGELLELLSPTLGREGMVERRNEQMTETAGETLAFAESLLPFVAGHVTMEEIAARDEIRPFYEAVREELEALESIEDEEERERLSRYVLLQKIAEHYNGYEDFWQGLAEDSLYFETDWWRNPNKLDDAMVMLAVEGYAGPYWASSDSGDAAGRKEWAASVLDGKYKFIASSLFDESEPLAFREEVFRILQENHGQLPEGEYLEALEDYTVDVPKHLGEAIDWYELQYNQAIVKGYSLEEQNLDYINNQATASLDLALDRLVTVWSNWCYSEKRALRKAIKQEEKAQKKLDEAELQQIKFNSNSHFDNLESTGVKFVTNHGSGQATIPQDGPQDTSKTQTKPSRPPNPNATPGGKPAKWSKNDLEEKITNIELQNKTAKILAQAGYEIEQLPESKEHGVKNPDYRIEGEIFDCYAPLPTTDAQGVWNGTKKKIGREQTKRVVINIENWGGSAEDIQKQFLTNRRINGLEEVIVVDGIGKITHLDLSKNGGF